MYYVYILKSQKTGSFYIGYTSNLNKRLKYHNIGLNKSTRNRSPWQIVYKEEFSLKSEAIKRERFLKKQKNKDFYERIISERSSDG